MRCVVVYVQTFLSEEVYCCRFGLKMVKDFKSRLVGYKKIIKDHSGLANRVS